MLFLILHQGPRNLYRSIHRRSHRSSVVLVHHDSPRSFREQDVMFLRRHTELNVGSVVPDFLHLLSGTLRCQDTALAQRYMNFVAAAAAAVGCCVVTCRTRFRVASPFLSSQLCLSLHFFPSVSSTALVAARHILLRPLAFRSVGPSSIRIQNATSPPCHVFTCSCLTNVSLQSLSPLLTFLGLLHSSFTCSFFS